MLNDTITAFVLPIEFSCLILYDKILVPNVYQIRLGINPISDNEENINFGFQRIKHLIDHCFQNSIFLESNFSKKELFDELDNNLIVLPCQVHDFYTGCVMFSKLITITEKYCELPFLSISSALGDNLQYNIFSPSDCDLDLKGDHWWNQDNVYTGSKINNTWEELDLIETKFKPILIKGGLSEN